MVFIEVMKTYIRKLDFVSKFIEEIVFEGLETIRDLVKEILVYYLKGWKLDFSLSQRSRLAISFKGSWIYLLEELLKAALIKY